MPITKPPKTSDKNSSKKADAFIKGKPEKSGSTQISLGIPKPLLQKIDDRADELSISRAAFIKQSCSLFLEKTN